MFFPLPSPSLQGDSLPFSGCARSLEDLINLGLASPSAELTEAVRRHPLAVTPVLLGLMDADDPNDPVARQFVPSPQEIEADPRALADPIGDQAHAPVPGIVHRYPDRLLLNLIQACPAYCRFCFRRGRVGKDRGILSQEETARALDYIRTHKEVREVILSGGEPLLLSARRLREIFRELRGIAHVEALRVHTRAPVSMPDIFTADFVRLLAEGPQPLRLLVHCNHPRELSPPARAALARLADAGVSLYSQSVLLKGVNDEIETLVALMNAFVACRIRPHYLHHPDLAEGTRHFRLPLKKGVELVRELGARLPDQLLPRYMLDIPGGHGKVRVLSTQVRETEGGWLLQNFEGQTFFYSDP